MKKIAILLLTLVTASVWGQTQIGGGIHSDTVLPKSQSPYIVTSSITVFPNASLTIKPGVEIRFNDMTGLEIRDSASLYAIGLNSDSILFTSNSSNPNRQSWMGINNNFGDTIQVSNVRISYADIGISNLQTAFTEVDIHNVLFKDNYWGILAAADIELRNCDFVNNTIGINGAEYSTIVRNCNFIDNSEHGLLGATATQQVINSFFCGNHIAIESMYYVRNNTIVNNDTGYVGTTGNLTNNVIAFNNVGINMALVQSDTIMGNHVFKNKIGASLNWWSNGYHLSGNKLCDNQNYNLIVLDTNGFDFSNTCWCTADTAVIENKIYDQADDLSRGSAIYQPFTNCNSSSLPPDPDTSCAGIISGIETRFNVENEDPFLFPNPANSIIYLKNPGNSSTTISVHIFNTHGQLEKSISSVSGASLIDVSELENGLYIVQIITGADAHTQKLIIRR